MAEEDFWEGDAEYGTMEGAVWNPLGPGYESLFSVLR
jgi:hypothetical protein